MLKSKKSKYIAGTLLVLGISGVAIGVNQWSNIKAVYSAFAFSEEEITKKRQKTQQEVNQVLKDYAVKEVRPLTEEETNQLISGELSVEDLTDKIVHEQLVDPETQGSSESTTPNSTTEDVATEEKKPQTEDSSKPEVEVSAEVQEKAIVAKYTSQMYILQSKYVGLLESLKNRGLGILSSIPSEERTLNNLKNAGMPLLQEAYALESTCDQEVDKILAALETELKAIDKDTSIISTMESAYETEKSLKKAYYISLAKSML